MSFKKHTAKRLREETSVLNCIKRTIDQLSGVNVLPLLFMINQCTEDLNSQFPIEFHFLKGGRSEQKRVLGTVYHLAIKKGLPQVVDAILEKGVDVNLETADGFSAIRLILECCSWAWDRKKEMIEVLLNYKIAINVIDIGYVIIANASTLGYNLHFFSDDYLNPLIIRMINKATPIEIQYAVNINLSFINIEMNRDYYPLTFLAALMGNLEIIKVMNQREDYLFYSKTSENGFDIIDVAFHNKSRLHFIHEFLYFVWVNRFELDFNREGRHIIVDVLEKSYNLKTVKLLLKCGADPNRCSTNNSPLFMAKDIDMKRLLLKYRADPNLEPHPRRSPIFNTQSETEDLLFLEHHADPKLTKFDGTSWLHLQFDQDHQIAILKALEPLFKRPELQIKM